MSSLLRPDRKRLYALSVFLLYCFYVFWPVNFYLAQTLKTTYYVFFVPVLVAAVVYFRGLRGGLEYRLLLAFCLWVWISRLLNGDLALQYDHELTLDLSLMIPFFALGLTLDAGGRRRFLNWLSGVTGGFFFVLGLISLTAFIRRALFINPITEGSLGMLAQQGFQRINILDVNPIATAYWFQTAFFLMVYQFFACKNKLWRIPIVLSALVDFLVITITYTRSVKLGIAVAMGLLAMLLVHERWKAQKKALRAAVLALCFVVSMLLVYKASDLCGEALTRLSYSLYPVQETAETPELAAEGAAAGGAEDAMDPRVWDGSLDSISSLRFTVWRSAFLALKVKPSVLFRGELLKDVMKISNTFTPHNPPHYHNVLLDVLMLTGLPGLLLAAALLWLAVVKTVRLFFCADPRATLAVKSLCLPVTSILIYNVFEQCLFSRCDMRSLYYYIIWGMLVGFYRELYPDAK